MPRNPELEIAYQILGGIPNEQIELYDVIVQAGKTIDGKPFCGTIACGIGWLLMHPRFVERGFAVRRKNGWTLYKTPGWKAWRPESYTYIASKMFGITQDEAQDLFCTRGCSGYDPTFSNMTDKQLLLHRIKSYLKDTSHSSR